MSEKTILLKDYKGITFRHPVKTVEDQALVRHYIDNEFNNDLTFEFMNQEYGWSKRKFIGKLVAFGIYKKDEVKKTEKKDKAPGKKELIADLEELLGLDDLSGLLPAKREALMQVINVVRQLKDEEVKE